MRGKRADRTGGCGGRHRPDQRGYRFDLTGALTAETCRPPWGRCTNFSTRGVHPLMVMAMITREIRFLFHAKLLLASGRLKAFSANMDYGRFQKAVFPPSSSRWPQGRSRPPRLAAPFCRLSGPEERRPVYPERTGRLSGDAVSGPIWRSSPRGRTPASCWSGC